MNGSSVTAKRSAEPSQSADAVSQADLGDLHRPGHGGHQLEGAQLVGRRLLFAHPHRGGNDCAALGVGDPPFEHQRIELQAQFAVGRHRLYPERRILVAGGGHRQVGRGGEAQGGGAVFAGGGGLAVGPGHHRAAQPQELPVGPRYPQYHERHRVVGVEAPEQDPAGRPDKGQNHHDGDDQGHGPRAAPAAAETPGTFEDVETPAVQTSQRGSFRAPAGEPAALRASLGRLAPGSRSGSRSSRVVMLPATCWRTPLG